MRKQRKYAKTLERFLRLIPVQIYNDSKINLTSIKDVCNLTYSFVLLARKDPKLVQNIIEDYIKEEKKLVDQNKLNPNTIPNHIKPIKVLLDSNEIPLHWKSFNPNVSQAKDFRRQGIF